MENVRKEHKETNTSIFNRAYYFASVLAHHESSNRFSTPLDGRNPDTLCEAYIVIIEKIFCDIKCFIMAVF
jgi:hypothetical protein